MSKNKEFFGIDISKDVFDVVDASEKHHQFKNDPSGFKEFSKLLCEKSHCVMEATGSYYQGLATWLYDSFINVSVVNPLSVKRFIQMRLKTSKTDKLDAQMIRMYGESEQPKLWSPPSKLIIEASEIHKLIELLVRQRAGLKNRLHALESKGITRSLVLTQGFEMFESSRQLISYLGLNPTIRESGSSVRGKSRISKTGDKQVRKLLFLCAFTAGKHNKACRKIYQRLTTKGKSKKLALIAVVNKLLKQSLAIAKSGLY